MFGDELHRLGGLGRLGRQEQRVRALALPSLRARFPVDLAVGMVQVGQLHHLHLVFGRRRGGARGRRRRQVRRRRVVRMRRAAHARHLHHPPQPRLLGPLHEHARRQVVQEHGPDPRRHPVGTRACKQGPRYYVLLLLFVLCLRDICLRANVQARSGTVLT